MARQGNLTFVPDQSSAGAPIVPLSQVPSYIWQEAEEIYEALKTHDGHFRLTFDTPAEADEYGMLIRSYCEQRPTEKGGPIRYRKSPIRNLPKNIIAFKIGDPDPEADAKAKANAEVKAAKAKVARVKVNA